MAPGARLEPTDGHEVHRPAEQRFEIILQREIPVLGCRTFELDQDFNVAPVGKRVARCGTEQRETARAEAPFDFALMRSEDLLSVGRHVVCVAACSARKRKRPGTPFRSGLQEVLRLTDRSRATSM